MNTLVIYDNTGYIISQMSGSVREPQGGVQFMWVTIPEGKRLVSINTGVTPNVPVFEVIPPTDEERLVAVENAITTLMGV